MNFFTSDNKSAIEAKGLAQWISFGPVVFQVARVLRHSGILEKIENSRSAGAGLEEISEAVALPLYGVRVLLESALGIGLVILREDRYCITKTGHFILHDELAKVNMDFVHDVCYKGLFHLGKSIETGRPEGLRELGPWPTIYDGIAQLPKQVQKSWFGFDHFFSDTAFPPLMDHVYSDPAVRRILDIGGNTGKWAIASCRYQPDIRITMVDLPGQLDVARENIDALGLADRVSFLPMNILDPAASLPGGFDAIWMSQFLDCFSEREIVAILQKCYDTLDEHGLIFILEAFWDRQRFETAAFCLQQTSIYFTAIANGNSQMYHSMVFLRCVREAGFEIIEQTDQIGLSHTLIKCKKKQ